VCGVGKGGGRFNLQLGPAERAVKAAKEHSTSTDDRAPCKQTHTHITHEQMQMIVRIKNIG